MSHVAVTHGKPGTSAGDHPHQDLHTVRVFLILALSVFTIPSAHGHIDLVYPDGPVAFISHQLVKIQWDVYISHGPGTISIEFSTNGGGVYSLIAADLPYSYRYGSYLWVVPAVDSANCKIRVNYHVTSGPTFYNGLYPGENDPTFSVQNIPSTELLLEDGLDGYDGTRDTTIYQGGGLDDYENNSNGGGDYLFAGNTNESFARRTLIAFDFSAIPPSALILSASLALNVSKTSAATSEQTLHRLTKDWGEGTQNAPDPEGQGIDAAPGDATWFSNFSMTSPWSAPGAEGDYVIIPSATASVAGVGAQGIWMTPQMVQDVTEWTSLSTPNYGWILIGDETSPQTTKRFYSSESPVTPSSQRPRLTIRYLLTTDVSDSSWQRYE